MKLFSTIGTLLVCLGMTVCMFISLQVGIMLSFVFFRKDVNPNLVDAVIVDGTLISYAMLFTLFSVSVVIFLLIKWRIKQVTLKDIKAIASRDGASKAIKNSGQRQYGVTDYLAIKPFKLRVAIALIGIWLLFLIGSEALTYFLDKDPTEFLDPLYDTANPRWLLVLAIVLIVPIYEELIFRGILWSALSNQLEGQRGIWLASIVTSLLFALIHMQYDIYEMSTIFVLALILSLARHRAGSLLLPILIHSINNGVAMWQYTTL